MRRFALATCMVSLVTATAFGATRTLTDADISASQSMTLSADTTYELNGIVYVEDGATLTIPPATVIKGQSGSALIIARGATIDAQGTRDNPIVFTASSDDVSDSSDLFYDDVGLWGGLAILGNAPVGVSGTAQIDRISSTNANAEAGGSNAQESSGTLRYVSIRHAGGQINGSDHMAGLLLAGVGSGTLVEYVEVFAGAQDNIILNGGTVNLRYISNTFCDDDNFTFKNGWSGNGQFWFTMFHFDTTDYFNHTVEHIGMGEGNNGNIPHIANITCIGDGYRHDQIIRAHHAFIFLDYAAARYYNSLLTDFTGKAVVIEDIQDDGVQDCRNRFEDGDIRFSGNIFHKFGKNREADSNFVFTWMEGGSRIYQTKMVSINEYGDSAGGDYTAIQDSMKDSSWAQGVHNMVASDAYIDNISRDRSGELDPRILQNDFIDRTTTTGYCFKDWFGCTECPSQWFTDTTFRGAFGATLWNADWTFLHESGMLIRLQDNAIKHGLHAGAARNRGMALHARTTGSTIEASYTLSESAPVTISLVDAAGKQIRVLPRQRKNAGMHRVSLSTEGLAPGVYMATLRTPAGSSNARCLITK